MSNSDEGQCSRNGHEDNPGTLLMKVMAFVLLCSATAYAVVSGRWPLGAAMTGLLLGFPVAFFNAGPLRPPQRVAFRTAWGWLAAVLLVLFVVTT